MLLRHYKQARVGPAFGDDLQGLSAMGSTGASHWSSLTTATYVAEYSLSGLVSHYRYASLTRV